MCTRQHTIVHIGSHVVVWSFFCHWDYQPVTFISAIGRILTNKLDTLFLLLPLTFTAVKTNEQKNIQKQLHADLYVKMSDVSGAFAY